MKTHLSVAPVGGSKISRTGLVYTILSIPDF